MRMRVGKGRERGLDVYKEFFLADGGGCFFFI